MSAPRPTTLVHPVTGVGSFFAFGGRRERGLVFGGAVSCRIAGGQGHCGMVPVCWIGYVVERSWFYDFRACEVVIKAYWEIRLFLESYARTAFLACRAAVTVHRKLFEEAVNSARWSGSIVRHAVEVSRGSWPSARRAFGIARRGVGAKIRSVQSARRTGRIIRWSFLPERVQESVKRRAATQSTVECGSLLPLFPASLLAMSLLASRSRVATCLRSGWPVSRKDAFFHSALRATPAGWRGESGSRLPHSAVLRTLNSQPLTII